MKIGITGASGFIGSALVSGLSEDVWAFGRNKPKKINDDHFVYMDLNDLSGFDASRLSELDVLVHCAARVHIVGEGGKSADKYEHINTDATLSLAKVAEQAGVKRFVFLSSLKACCNGMLPRDNALTENSPLTPNDNFGRSKAEAEKRLLETFTSSRMDVVIIRSPLVYGPRVRANFKSMLDLASSGIPLPLGKFDENRRSFIYIENLVEFIRLCLTADAASGQVFLVADTGVVSTKQLFAIMRRFMKIPPRFIGIPIPWLGWLFCLIGRQGIVEQLNVSLFLDAGKAKRVLGWEPTATFEQGMLQTVNTYMKSVK